MLPDRAHAVDIVTASKKIDAIVGGLTRESFEQNETAQLAVLHLLTIIGEASRRISASFHETHAQQHFRSAIAMRNIIVHQYDAIDLDIVWRTATVSIPQFRQTLETIIGVETGDDQTE